MANINLKALIGRLNKTCKQALQDAAGLCVNRRNYEVNVEHFVQALVDDPQSDLRPILSYFEKDLGRFQKALAEVLDRLPTGNTGRPVFSPLLTKLLEHAWILSSVNLGLAEMRSGTILLALLETPGGFGMGRWLDILETIPVHQLQVQLLDIIASSAESKRADLTTQAAQTAASGGAARPSGDGSALERYAMNFTQRAREDAIDPVFGRDREIRQMVDILARRRKNNPIVVGEAGVGKTALVEGLAVRIVAGDVPDVLANVEIIGLDMGLLQAGAGIKGEFEERLKQVIEEVKASPVPIVLFIDEAHTLIGAGNQTGGSDAANLLKPALARGELRTVAATTWSEYKKYFEKDAALSRRFQLVKVDEPDVASTTTMLRGLRTRYEAAHGVIIRDDALVAAAELGSRYIAGRYQPDKGIDLMDTAAARVRVALTSKPGDLEDAERLIETLARERDALLRDAENCAVDVEERLGELEGEIANADIERARLETLWEHERKAADVVVAIRQSLSAAELHARGEIDPEDEEAPAKPTESIEALRAQLHGALAKLRHIQGSDPLVNVEVTPEVIARIVSDWTGIPLGRMVRDQAQALLNLEEKLGERIKGQDHVLESIGARIRAAKAGLKDPKVPMGAFLFVGPSGVGKTETALGVADLLFGGERFLTTINMSEFQEKHTVSRLIGSPPGYVGYGEGGVLTEAVRQRPYSAVLLDEVEKGHPEVLNLFYQVFDKGLLADGEGRVIDFKDTVIFMTTNLTSDTILKWCEDDARPSPDKLVEKIRPTLSDYFKPALLARMTIVPFYPIGSDVMSSIVELKLGRLAARLEESHKMEMVIDDAVVQTITDRCTEVETGARNIDHIINGTLLPEVSTQILQRMAEGAVAKSLHIGVDDKSRFTYDFA
jgi:type VI secretion system protein VasG